MAKELKKQAATVERVMHEYKEGDLKSGGGNKVKSRKQAIAIALSEAGESNKVGPAENRRRARRIQARERDDGRTRAELYEQAKRKNVPGRSKMNKAQLAKAVGR